jgi:hypothetical protein
VRIQKKSVYNYSWPILFSKHLVAVSSLRASSLFLQAPDVHIHRNGTKAKREYVAHCRRRMYEGYLNLVVFDDEERDTSSRKALP